MSTETETNRLVWLDLEMTGLSLERDNIIEIATIITDSQLNIIAEGPNLVIHQPESLLAQMDNWCQKQHGSSGLLALVRESQITVAQAEDQTIAFLQQYVAPKKAPLCGNSICTDRQFLRTYMPRLESFFHYRNIDVSTLKELAKRWSPDVAASFNKESAHRATGDIKESIAEMAHYRAHFIKEGT